MGHARALLSLTDEADQRRVARDVIARGLSVRETEALVRKTSEAAKPAAAPAPKPVDVHTRAAEDRLRLALGTRVRIVRQGSRGRIEIEFGSEDELIRIYDQTHTVVRAFRPARKENLASDPHGRLRRLSEQTRRRRARSGAERHPDRR